MTLSRAGADGAGVGRGEGDYHVTKLRMVVLSLLESRILVPLSHLGFSGQNATIFRPERIF